MAKIVTERNEILGLSGSQDRETEGELMFVRNKHREAKSERFYASDMSDKQRLWREIRLREIQKHETADSADSEAKKDDH